MPIAHILCFIHTTRTVYTTLFIYSLYLSLICMQLPDQVQVINPLLILILIPIFNYGLYPLLAMCNVLTQCASLNILFPNTEYQKKSE